MHAILQEQRCDKCGHTCEFNVEGFIWHAQGKRYIELPRHSTGATHVSCGGTYAPTGKPERRIEFSEEDKL